MRHFILTVIAGMLLASCAPQPAPIPTGIPSPTATVFAHAPQIRFALIGEPQDVNAWQLFDASGASYANYAIRFEYWPRLYHLVPPGFDFQPLAAEGIPSAVMQDGDEYSATVKLRTDLKWTDTTPFTADDVAFTVNTSMKYELGHDWETYYPREILDRVEATDSSTVKFYFKKEPNVEVWQYGALQGPILQKAFWESRIAQSSALLPDEKIAADIKSSTEYLNTVQARVDDLTAQVNALMLKGQENRDLSGELVKRQGELGFAKNNLNKLFDDRAAKVESAHQALYAADDAGEPTLGTWTPAAKENNTWTNTANPDFPFVQPHFDKVVFEVFDSEESAYAAFTKGDVDAVLSPSGLTGQSSPKVNPTSSVRFLVFNPENAVLSDVALRKAMSCMIDPQEINLFPGEFVPAIAWKNTDAAFPCSGVSREQRIEKAVGFLKQAGYGWAQEPNSSQPGSGLKLPDGTDFPRIILLSTSADVDVDRADMANYIGQQALHLGIPIDVQLTDLASLQYAVYSSKKYDMAVFGWRLSEYPGYLCDWFGTGGQFEDISDKLKSACEALAGETDLKVAQGHFFDIQSALMEDLPFIPLYAKTTQDAFQHIQYPFDSVLEGVDALYGAPSYALPTP